MSLPFVNVEEETFGKAYNRLLFEVYFHGIPSSKGSYAYGTEKDFLFRECESRVLIKDALGEPMLSLAMGLKNFSDYIGDILLGKKDELVGKGVYTYTYSERIKHPIDQIVEVIKRIGKRPYTNRAVICTWRVPKDTLLDSGQPCLNRIWFKVFGNTLRMHTDWRSRDLTYAWDVNVIGMIGLGKLVMDCLNDYYGLDLRKLEYVDRCDSLHVYEGTKKDFMRRLNALKKRGEKTLLFSTSPFLKKLWKGKSLFEDVDRAKRRIDPIFRNALAGI